jgi:hypothetical protein
MPRAPRLSTTSQFPLGADILNNEARISITDLGHATHGQQDRLLNAFQTIVEIPGTVEPEEDLFRWGEHDAIRPIPTRQRRATRYAIPAGTRPVAAWDRLALHTPEGMLRDFFDTAIERRDHEMANVYARLLERLGAPPSITSEDRIRWEPRPGDIAMFNNNHPGIVNGWLRPSAELNTSGARITDSTMDEGNRAGMVDASSMIDRMTAAVNATVTPVVRAASDAMTGLSAAMSAPAITMPEGATRYHARVEHDQPEALARVTAPARFTAIREVRPTVDDVRSAGLVEALITADNVPTDDTMERTTKGIQRWLKNVYGVHVHGAVIQQIADLFIKMARPVYLRQKRAMDRQKAELIDSRRHVRELKDSLNAMRARLTELEEGPRATPEQAAKAARYDEAMTVALQWEQAPKGGVEKLNAFRKLHHTLTVLADEAATVAAAVAEVDDLADALITGIPAEFAIAG